MITIEGLSPVQRDLADRMWEIESTEEVEQFIAALPTKWLRGQARTVYDMLVIAYIDSVVAEMPQFPDADNLVDKFRG